MSIELTRPVFLLGLLLLGGLYAGYHWSLIDFSRTQRFCSLAVRSLILVLLVLALAGLTLLTPTHEKHVVFLVDESQSIDENAKKIAADFLANAEKAASSSFSVYPFSSFPAVEETNIAAAIPVAIAMTPPDKIPYLVLLSDGNETVGNALETAMQSGVTISTVPLPAPDFPEVELTEIRVPSQIRQGEPFTIEIVVQSNRQTETGVTLSRGNPPDIIVDEIKSLRIGENVLRYQQTINDQSQEIFTTILDCDDDTTEDNNTAKAFVFVKGKPRILVLESDPKTVETLAQTLRVQGIDVDVRAADDFSLTPEELDSFDAVLLSNVPATAFSREQMEQLRVYVRDLGGGLLMLGGEHSSGPGGYSLSPLEEILPVSCRFEKENEKPSLAIGLVLDRSGSMGGEKLEMAKEAAKSCVELMTPRDFIAVLAFDQECHAVVPIQNVSSQNNILAAISKMEAAGGTNLAPAMLEAYQQMSQVSAKLKHLIILTDGITAMGNYAELTQQFTNSQITVSTVNIGNADSEVLKMISQNSGGRSYVCSDPQAVPQIFVRETILASKSTIREEPFVPIIVDATEVLAGIPWETAPPLLGFVATQPKPTSRLVLATATGEPLLASWRYGLGQTATFTSDAKTRWAAQWIPWDGFATFWTQLVRSVMRKSLLCDAQIDITKNAGRFFVRIDAVKNFANSEQFLNQGTGKLTAIDPDLSTEEHVLNQTAPGRYEASFPADKPGGHQLRIELKDGEKTVVSQTRYVMVDATAEERRLKPTNERLLRQIAESTGGEYNPTPKSVFLANPKRTVLVPIPLEPYLLSLAAMLFIVDVFLRRVRLFENEPQ